MSKPQKKGLVPALRFLEFQNAGEWEKTRLIDLAINGFSNGVFNDPKKVGYGYKLVNVLDMYLDTTINEASLSLIDIGSTEFEKNKVECGDVFFTRSSLVKAGIAHSNIYLGSSNNITFDGHLIRLRPNQSIIKPIFLHYVLKTRHTRTQLIAKGKSATMTTIGQADIASTTVFKPKLEEQQKIADCLASIDDLITAETQKLAALKTHKKGLMQQLFPAEGETVPRLRFPEFRDTGEWEEKNLTEIAKTSIGLVTTMTTSYANTGVPLIRNSDIQQNKVRKEKLIFLMESFADKYSNKKLKKGDIVTVHTGDIGVSAVIDSDLSGCLGFATLNTRILKCDVLPEYICWYFNSERYISFAVSMATGDGRNNFNLNDFNQSLIPIPSQAEQQKIADCLSSIDELIAAQGEKIEALKLHKKGLMQQLFPVMEEVEA